MFSGCKSQFVLFNQSAPKQVRWMLEISEITLDTDRKEVTFLSLERTEEGDEWKATYRLPEGDLRTITFNPETQEGMVEGFCPFKKEGRTFTFSRKWICKIKIHLEPE